MNIAHRIFFSSALTLSIVSVTNVQAAIKSLSDSSKELIDPKEFWSATPMAMKHFCAIKEISNILWSLITIELQKPEAERCFNSVHDFRTEEAAPYLAATIQGLFLIVSYNDEPLYLWAPWGSISLAICGSYKTGWAGAWKSIQEKLFTLITTEPYDKDASPYKGNFDIYKVLAVNGKPLPESILRDPVDLNRANGNWTPYNITEKVWDNMETAYEQMENK